MKRKQSAQTSQLEPRCKRQAILACRLKMRRNIQFFLVKWKFIENIGEQLKGHVSSIDDQLKLSFFSRLLHNHFSIYITFFSFGIVTNVRCCR